MSGDHGFGSLLVLVLVLNFVLKRRAALMIEKPGAFSGIALGSPISAKLHG